MPNTNIVGFDREKLESLKKAYRESDGESRFEWNGYVFDREKAKFLIEHVDELLNDFSIA